MRITIIAGALPSTTFIDALINGLAERGCSVTVIGKKRNHYSYLKNVNTIEIPSKRISQFLFVIVNLWKIPFFDLIRIYKISNSSVSAFFDYLYYLPIFMAKPDKVHIQWAADLYNRELLFDLFPDKIILSLRGAHINYTPIIKPEYGEFYKKVFPKIHKLHAVSNAIALEAQKYDATKEKIQTIYSFVLTYPAENIISMPHPNNPLKIISVGRFHWKKGYEHAIDAMHIMKLQNIKFHYTIIAQGDIPENINFQINQLELRNNISIVNGLPHQDVIMEITKNDLFLLPSVEEGIANVVLEAMSVGVPVLSTRCGGMSEVITDNSNGLLTNIRDSQMMAQKIIQFSKLDLEEKLKMIKNAQEQMMVNHSKTKFLDQFKKLYN